MLFERDNDRTINHPKIKAFLKACEQATGGKLLSLPVIQSAALIKFSSQIMTAVWVPNKKDFKFKFCGTHIAKNYGMDITGKYIAETTPPEASQQFIELYKEIIRDQKNIFLGGTLEPRGKEYIDWDQVSMPLERNGRVNEVITFVATTLRKK